MAAADLDGFRAVKRTGPRKSSEGRCSWLVLCLFEHVRCLKDKEWACAFNKTFRCMHMETGMSGCILSAIRF